MFSARSRVALVLLSLSPSASPPVHPLTPLTPHLRRPSPSCACSCSSRACSRCFCVFLRSRVSLRAFPPCFCVVPLRPLSHAPNLAARAPRAAPLYRPCTLHRTRFDVLIFALKSVCTMSSLLPRYLVLAVLAVFCFSAQVSVYSDASCLQRMYAFSVFADVCTALSTSPATPMALLKCSSDALTISFGAPLPGNQTLPLACNDMSSSGITVSTACSGVGGGQWMRITEPSCNSNGAAFVVAAFKDSLCNVPYFPNASIWDTLVLSSCRDEIPYFLTPVSAYSARRSRHGTHIVKFTELNCSDSGSVPFYLPSTGECSPNSGSAYLLFARQFPASPFDPSLANTYLTADDLLLRAAGTSFAQTLYSKP